MEYETANVISGQRVIGIQWWKKWRGGWKRAFLSGGEGVITVSTSVLSKQDRVIKWFYGKGIFG